MSFSFAPGFSRALSPASVPDTGRLRSLRNRLCGTAYYMRASPQVSYRSHYVRIPDVTVTWQLHDHYATIPNVTVPLVIGWLLVGYWLGIPLR